MRPLLLTITIMLAILCCSVSAVAERGVLVVYVADVQGRPISQIEIGTKGEGGSARTQKLAELRAVAVGGKARLPLPPDTKPNANVSLYIVQNPRGHDFVMISPWDGIVRVPPFENESDNFTSLIVAERGDRVLLENGKALATITAQILKANSPAVSGSATPEDRRREAMDEVARGFGLPPDDIDNAIREWSKKVQDPSDKALAALYARNYPEATKLFNEALEVDRQQLQKAQDKVFSDERFLAESLFWQKQYSQSAEAAKQALKVRPDDVGVHELLGLALLDNQDRDAAIAEFREAIRLKPDDINAHNLLGLAIISKSGRDTALGLALDAKADRDAAIAEFREAVRLKPGDSDAHNALAAALDHDGQYDAAIAEYQEAIRLKPGDFVAHLNLANTLRQQGKDDEAIAEVRKAVRLKPNFFEAHNRLGLALLGKGKYDEAITEFREAIRLEPNDEAAYKSLGGTFLLKSQFDAAIDELGNAIRLKPDDAQVHALLGLALLGSGKHEDGLREIRRAYEIDPKDDVVRHAYEMAKNDH